VQEAADQFGQLLADRVRVLGPDHPDILITRRNLDYSKTRSGCSD